MLDGYWVSFRSNVCFLLTVGGAGACAPATSVLYLTFLKGGHETRWKSRSESQDALTNPAFSGVVLKYESPACAESRNGPPDF